MNDIYKMEIADKNKLEKIWKIIGNYSEVKRKIIGNQTNSDFGYRSLKRLVIY